MTLFECHNLTFDMRKFAIEIISHVNATEELLQCCNLSIMSQISNPLTGHIKQPNDAINAWINVSPGIGQLLKILHSYLLIAAHLST